MNAGVGVRATLQPLHDLRFHFTRRNRIAASLGCARLYLRHIFVDKRFVAIGASAKGIE